MTGLHDSCVFFAFLEIGSSEYILQRFTSFVRSQKLRFSGFGISCGLRISSNLAVGFRFLPTMMVVFRILLPNSFYGFSGFAKKVTSHSHVKNVIPRNHLQLKECMISLVSLAALI